MKPASNITLNGSAIDLAFWLGVSDRRVRQLVEEKVVVQVSRGVYDIPASVQRYIERLKITAETQGSKELLKERTLLTREKRRQAEIQTAALEGRMLPADMVQAFWADMVQSANTKLDAIPTALAGPLASETNPVKVQQLLGDALGTARNELANYDAEKFVDKYIAKYGAELRETAEADDGETLSP